MDSRLSPQMTIQRNVELKCLGPSFCMGKAVGPPTPTPIPTPHTCHLYSSTVSPCTVPPLPMIPRIAEGTVIPSNDTPETLEAMSAKPSSLQSFEISWNRVVHASYDSGQSLEVVARCVGNPSTGADGTCRMQKYQVRWMWSRPTQAPTMSRYTVCRQ